METDEILVDVINRHLGLNRKSIIQALDTCLTASCCQSCPFAEDDDELCEHHRVCGEALMLAAKMELQKVESVENRYIRELHNMKVRNATLLDRVTEQNKELAELRRKK